MSKILRKENWDRGRWFSLLFLALCLFVTLARRQSFYGEPSETAIGWDTARGTTDFSELNEETVLRQVFYPQSGILSYIYVAIGGHGQTGAMVVTVYDEKDQEIAVRELPCAQMVESGAQGVNINVRVTPGREYAYTLTFREVEDEYPVVRTAWCLTEGELGTLYLDGQPQEQKIYGLFVYQPYYTESYEWHICLAVTALAFLLLALYPWLPLWETRLLPLFLYGHALLGVFLLELTAGAPQGLTWRKLLYNTILCSFLFLFLFLFLWNGKLLLKTGTILCFLLGVAQYYVLKFRGTPLVPGDLLSIGTAMEVSGNYRFDLPPQMITSFLVLAVVLLWERKIRFKKYTLRVRGAVLCLLLLCGAGSFGYLRSRPVLSTGNNGGFFWSMTESYKKYGYLLSTYIYQHYQVIEKPDTYSEKTVEDLMEEVESQKEAAAGAGDEGQYPNIIAIMNESFTDFASVGGLETSEPVTPFLDSLEENTVRGNLYVSVFGGGTANTEFEFLTGSTMGFLPAGSTPYQAYIKKELPSLASCLKQYDYTSLVCHFANRTNWNRDQVYPLLGFDAYLSEEDAGELDTIHGYPSDAANYREVLRLYEDWKAQGETAHFFCFNVTIQNHGGYTSGYRCEDPPQYTGGQSQEDVEEYLSLLRESDLAFKELVEYFQNEEEPAVILMFGDHWPRLNGSFISALTSQAGDVSGLEKNQNKYVTPFVIWANYDIEEERIEKLSANYLGALLLKTAGIPQNGYQFFLEELSRRIPVINALGYVDSAGNYLDSSEELEEENIRWVEAYQILQYDNLFGKTDGSGGFFG